ncbi:hypothetical protein COCMIDRAFT_25720 [Bipolaris oryzae ATCC 44560]|uniref:Uncharacterized protein n=1 Tax=Bipolaris oryzae ATCC 44560 TaxID=930090 RepID=W6Z372_COCMI|nr:uncharacterized protein COCMIDRAFT_25720 [Bipolaris oryzae ATCC 44560]EUC46172.1 hypothetical protein COCMIDRAFT_25720 [Bipolaris oryzae ATCC 44560]
MASRDNTPTGCPVQAMAGPCCSGRPLTMAPCPLHSNATTYIHATVYTVHTRPMYTYAQHAHAPVPRGRTRGTVNERRRRCSYPAMYYVCMDACSHAAVNDVYTIHPFRVHAIPGPEKTLSSPLLPIATSEHRQLPFRDHTDTQQHAR